MNERQRMALGLIESIRSLLVEGRNAALDGEYQRATHSFEDATYMCERAGKRLEDLNTDEAND